MCRILTESFFFYYRVGNPTNTNKTVHMIILQTNLAYDKYYSYLLPVNNRLLYMVFHLLPQL